VRLWPLVPSSEGCGAASGFVCVAVATSIVRLSPKVRGAEGLLAYDARLGMWGDRHTHVHHQDPVAGGQFSVSVSHNGRDR
jgi:hypothetical protein